MVPTPSRPRAKAASDARGRGPRARGVPLRGAGDCRGAGPRSARPRRGDPQRARRPGDWSTTSSARCTRSRGWPGSSAPTAWRQLSHELEELLDDLRLGRVELTAIVLDSALPLGRALRAHPPGREGGPGPAAARGRRAHPRSAQGHRAGRPRRVHAGAVRSRRQPPRGPHRVRGAPPPHQHRPGDAALPPAGAVPARDHRPGARRAQGHRQAARRDHHLPAHRRGRRRRLDRARHPDGLGGAAGGLSRPRSTAAASTSRRLPGARRGATPPRPTGTGTRPPRRCPACCRRRPSSAPSALRVSGLARRSPRRPGMDPLGPSSSPPTSAPSARWRRRCASTSTSSTG